MLNKLLVLVSMVAMFGCGGEPDVNIYLNPSTQDAGGDGNNEHMLPSPVCEVGRVVECPCLNGTTGIQKCDLDGMGWSFCECPAVSEQEFVCNSDEQCLNGGWPFGCYGEGSGSQAFGPANVWCKSSKCIGEPINCKIGCKDGECIDEASCVRERIVPDQDGDGYGAEDPDNIISICVGAPLQPGWMRWLADRVDCNDNDPQINGGPDSILSCIPCGEDGFHDTPDDGPCYGRGGGHCDGNTIHGYGYMGMCKGGFCDTEHLVIECEFGCEPVHCIEPPVEPEPVCTPSYEFAPDYEFCANTTRDGEWVPNDDNCDGELDEGCRSCQRDEDCLERLVENRGCIQYQGNVHHLIIYEVAVCRSGTCGRYPAFEECTNGCNDADGCIPVPPN